MNLTMNTSCHLQSFNIGAKVDCEILPEAPFLRLVKPEGVVEIRQGGGRDSNVGHLLPMESLTASQS